MKKQEYQSPQVTLAMFEVESGIAMSTSQDFIIIEDGVETDYGTY